MSVRLSCVQRFGGLFLLVLMGVLCSVSPALAHAKTTDITATHRYLEARIALQQTATRDKAAQLKAIDALTTQVNAECPGVLAGAPMDVKQGESPSQERFEISLELLTAPFHVAERVERSADAMFERKVRHLRWSNLKLTKLLRSLAIEQAEQSAIQPPDLCSDLKSWVASGYTTTSPGTKRYVHRIRVVSSTTLIESEPHEPAAAGADLNTLVAYRLKPYEDQAEHRLARKALPREHSLTSPAAKPFLDAVDRVLAALGSSPVSAVPPFAAGPA